MVAVADGFDRDEHATFEDETAHQFARPKVVDVFGDDHFCSQGAESRVPIVSVAATRPVQTIIESADGMADVSNRRWRAANRKDLLLVHAVTNELATAAKRMRRLTQKQTDDDYCRNEK